jgi:N-acylneuraminate cytidylyltransferase
MKSIEHRNIAFIFARGGSKGLPRKNIKLLNGKPLIQYSIETARSSNEIDDLFVSTDDREISEFVKSLGVNVIERPNVLATDESPEWLSWQHAVTWVKNNIGEFNQFISLPTTSPLRSVEDVNLAVAKLKSSQSDVCIAVTPASRSPYFNMVKMNDKGFIELVVAPENNVIRRQDAPEVFDITTSVYVTTPDFIMSNKGLFSGNISCIYVPKERAVDIDDIYDFMLAESILEARDVKR